jgi:hypothetical protein
MKSRSKRNAMTEEVTRRAMKPPITHKTRDSSRGLPLFIFALLLLVYWFFAWMIQGMGEQPVVPQFWQQVVAQYPLMEPATSLVTRLAGMFSWQVLRNFIPVVAGAVFAYRTTVAFVQAVYEFPDSAEASTFLGRLQGRIGKPINIGRQSIDTQRLSEPILRVGGPAEIRIPAGEVIVTEVNGRYNRVMGPGKRKLARFETVKQILDLREHSRSDTDVVLTTKEGLRIKTDVTVVFRLFRGNRVPTRANPFPYDEESVRKAAYGEIVGEHGDVSGWETLPLMIAIQQLREKVADLRMDQLIDPHKRQADPHPTVQLDVQRTARHKLFEMGVDLISTRLGAFQLPPDVHETLLDYWNVSSEQPKVALEPTVAELEAEKEMVRANLREQMIQAIATSLQELQKNPNQTANQQEILMGYRTYKMMDKLLLQSERHDEQLRALTQQRQPARLEDHGSADVQQLESGSNSDSVIYDSAEDEDL